MAKTHVPCKNGKSKEGIRSFPPRSARKVFASGTPPETLEEKSSFLSCLLFRLGGGGKKVFPRALSVSRTCRRLGQCSKNKGE